MAAKTHSDRPKDRELNHAPEAARHMLRHVYPHADHGDALPNNDVRLYVQELTQDMVEIAEIHGYDVADVVVRESEYADGGLRVRFTKE